MTKLNRLNVDITATTTQFDSAMTRVRNSMATFGRAGSAGAGLAASPGFGSMGGFFGLSGPLLALGAGIGVLTKVISEANRLAEVNNKAAQAADSAGLTDSQAVVRGQLGALIGPGGGVESFTRLKDMFDLGGQFMGREGIDASRMSDAEFLRAIVAVSRQSNVMDLVRTGVLPRDILAARDVDTTLIAKTLRNADRSLALSRYKESLRQQNVAESGRPDPGFWQAPTNTQLAWLEEFFSFFTGSPSQSVTDHLEVLRNNTRWQELALSPYTESQRQANVAFSGRPDPAQSVTDHLEVLRNNTRFQELSLSRYTESQRQANVAFSGRPDPGVSQAPSNTLLALLEELFGFFSGAPSQSVTTHLETISNNTQSQGPGI